MPSYWTPLGSAAHNLEEAALRFIADRLEKAGDPQSHLWSSFMFQASTGVIYEVDGLLLTPQGLVVLEIKSWQDDKLLIEGDRWVRTRTREGLRNPRFTADMKARCLRSILQANGIPACSFVTSAVFLSEASVRFAVTGDQLPPGVFTHDSLNHQRPIRMLLDGSQHPLPQSSGVPSPAAVANALYKAGISPRARATDLDHGRLTVLGPLDRDLDDDLPYTERLVQEVGPKKKHEARMYHVRRDANAAERARVRTEALREYNSLEQLGPLNHSAILRPTQWVDDDRGPVLLFPHLPEHVRLDDWLTLHEDASLDVRLQLARAVADPIRHAHSYGVFHRALTPGAVLVNSGWPGERVIPDVRVTHWHAATQAQRTRHSTVGHALRNTTLAWTAPELLADPHVAHAQLDVYSLGAITWWLLTGRRPAPGSSLDREAGARVDVPSSVRADVPEALDQAVAQALHLDPAKRTGSVDAFLAAIPRHAPEPAPIALTAPPADPDILYAAAGTQVGNFLIGERLGEGSSAVVLEALDGASNQVVALKVAKEGYEDAIKAEAEAYIRLQQTDCRRVLKSYGLHTLPHGRVALALSSFRNHTLASELRGRPYDAPRALRFGDQLLEGLVELERAGVLHRDIKPSNLAIVGREDRTTEELVLFDFSLHGLPLDKIDVGTRPWQDPWVGVHGRSAHDTAVDRWAAAIVLHELLTGKRPAWGEDGQAAPDRSLRPDIATLLLPEQHRDALARFLKQALEPQASERFRSAADMRQAWNHAFEQATSQQPVSSMQDWISSLRGTLPQRSLHEVGLRADVVQYLQDRSRPIGTLSELANAGSSIYISAPSEIRRILRPIYEACHHLFVTAHATSDGEGDERRSVSELLTLLAKGSAPETRGLLRMQQAPVAGSVPWPWPPLNELLPAVWPNDPQPQVRFAEWLQRAAAKRSLQPVRQWALAFIEAHDGIVTDAELTFGLLATLGGELHDETKRLWDGAALAQVVAWLLERHPLPNASTVMMVRGAQGVLFTLRSDVGEDLLRAAGVLDALVTRGQGAVVSSSELASTLLATVRGRPLYGLGLARVGVLAAHLSQLAAVSSTGEAYTPTAPLDALVQAVARQLQYRDVITLPLLRQVLAVRFPAAPKLTSVESAQRALERAGFADWKRERVVETPVSAPLPTLGGRGRPVRSRAAVTQGTLPLLDAPHSADAGQGGSSLDDDRWLWRSPFSQDDVTGTRVSRSGTSPTSGALTGTRHSGPYATRAVSATDMQWKLQQAWTERGLRLLQTPVRHARAAHLRLCELWPELRTCSVELLWRDQIETFVQQNGLGERRSAFVQALFTSAAAPSERATYDTLMNDRIWPAVLQRLQQLSEPTLLTELAIMPAPMRRSLIAACSSDAGARPVLWVLLPASETGSAVHVIDGDPLPIAYEHQKLALSTAWCEAPLDELRAVTPVEVP